MQNYAFPGIVKYVLIQYQEYLNTLQQVSKVCDPSLLIDLRSSVTTIQMQRSTSNLDATQSKATSPKSNIASSLPSHRGQASTDIELGFKEPTEFKYF